MPMTNAYGDPSLDLDAYLSRIGYQGGLDPNLETLRSLHQAHALHIPFEDLDVLLGQPIALDLERLQAKLVAGRRGGYCFEHNSLFAAVLESLGFHLTRLAARVRLGGSRHRPRTHMLLSVDLEGEPWLADVGFGGGGLLHPIPLRSRELVTQAGWNYRLVDEEGGIHVLQTQDDGAWLDLYAFTQEPQIPIDYVVANHFTSTHPQSLFRNTLLVQQTGLESRIMLLNRELTEQRPEGRTTTILPDDDAILTALADRFGLHFPRGTRLPFVERENVFAAESGAS
jgi:N-hydroxyarylamine O-acetyltransferase